MSFSSWPQLRLLADLELTIILKIIVECEATETNSEIECKSSNREKK